MGELEQDEVTERHGLRVTTAARTLLDLAAVVRRSELERALHEAEVQRLGDTVPLPTLLERHRGRRGTATLRAILDDATLGAGVPRSELEDVFAGFVARHELPRPQLNRLVEGFLADAVWPAARLVAELDGHATHHTRRRFESDRARDRALQVAGWRVARITWRQLHDEPARLAADLRRLLHAAGHA